VHVAYVLVSRVANTQFISEFNQHVVDPGNCVAMVVRAACEQRDHQEDAFVLQVFVQFPEVGFNVLDRSPCMYVVSADMDNNIIWLVDFLERCFEVERHASHLRAEEWLDVYIES